MVEQKKCYKCSKNAVLKCGNPKCNHYICQDHAHKIHYAIKCDDCRDRDMKSTRYRIISMISFMFLILIVVIIWKF